MRMLRNAALVAVVFGAMAGVVSAGTITVLTSVVGAAPSGVKRDNLDWLGVVGQASGVGLTVNVTNDARWATGSVSGEYAAPFLSGSNGIRFGNPSGNQAPGVDQTVYLTSGAQKGGHPNAGVQLLLPESPTGYLYLGLLWGSIDDYNTLDFFNGETLVGRVTGGQVTASPNGDQGVNGTSYVNLLASAPFTRVVATSTAYAFEFDNIAFNETNPVPEPASMLLLGTGLFGLAGAARRRPRK